MVSNPQIYLDISIAGEKIGRIVCELFAEKAPTTVKNFRSLCLEDHCIEEDKVLTYRGNYFHRIIKNFVVQCGDIIHCSGEFVKSDDAGKGGCSIFATREEIHNGNNSELQCFGNFLDENLGDFNASFYLAMANMGTPDSNSSQFFITTAVSPHLNGKHSIFGRVTHGKSVVRSIEYSKVDSDGFPLECIKIDQCGDWDILKGLPLFNASNDSIGGDTYEEYPDDNEDLDSEDFSAAYEAANIIKESGTLLYKKKDYKNAYFKYNKSLRYVNEFIPDIEVDAENNRKFTHLKIKLYLNMSLVSLKMKRYDEAIKFSSFLLDMNEVPNIDQCKALYRRGEAFVAKKHYENALQDYKSCQEINPDDRAVMDKILSLEKTLEDKKEKTKRNIAKFFSSS
ncbi:hypothetical protein HG535_0B03730 [Zygotorulaspora mrakii]|uniref:peptidylprolyl isomerase n=1 Tax=Zygotorulaspora mrakii TaxID=42260 RepID=A0A7H9AYQ6_ZYGMR|nr:uncharacterized protein HG535_0B03730 [Zygotorulaspora mrakii]QLG71333.1 hypothetical protein HG535_0B03730 [Zygotorulaspora mrakii]